MSLLGAVAKKSNIDRSETRQGLLGGDVKVRESLQEISKADELVAKVIRNG